jgi:hypothetical protein
MTLFKENKHLLSISTSFSDIMIRKIYKNIRRNAKFKVSFVLAQDSIHKTVMWGTLLEREH